MSIRNDQKKTGLTENRIVSELVEKIYSIWASMSYSYCYMILPWGYANFTNIINIDPSVIWDQ